jgi:hypothetical protein
VKVLILNERIQKFIDRIAERVREMVEVLRELPEQRELVPQPVPVRIDQ